MVNRVGYVPISYWKNRFVGNTVFSNKSKAGACHSTPNLPFFSFLSSQESLLKFLSIEYVIFLTIVFSLPLVSLNFSKCTQYIVSWSCDSFQPLESLEILNGGNKCVKLSQILIPLYFLN